MSKARDKQIDYVQTAIKQDIKNGNWSKRSIAEINELTGLIVSQYQDMKSFKIVRSGKGNDALDQKDTKSINDVKTFAVGRDGKTKYNGDN